MVAWLRRCVCAWVGACVRAWFGGCRGLKFGIYSDSGTLHCGGGGPGGLGHEKIDAETWV